MTNSSCGAARPRLGWVCLLALSLPIAGFLAQAHYGFSLWDEGYLWYGVRRVMLGEVPIRDFMAYDPGRYYWSAALMTAWGGHGVVALRMAEAITQMVALFAGCMVIARATRPLRDRGWLLLAAATVMAWLTPGYKTCDFAVSIGLVAMMVCLAERPTTGRHFLAGVAVGLAAVSGRNHGMYGVGGSIIMFALLTGRREPGCTLPRAIGAWVAGVVVGYLPILIMLAGCPGFARPFWDGVVRLVESGSFNTPLPIPWPWHARIAPLGVGTFVRDIVTGLIFLGLLVFGLGGLAWSAWRAWRRRPLTPAWLACVAMSLPYAHYAFARADYEHLALGIFPTLLGCLVWLAGRPATLRWTGGGVLAAASLMTIGPTQSRWHSWKFHWNDTVTIAGDAIRVDPLTAREIELLRVAVQRYAPHGESILCTPFWPGAYALLDRRAPVWDIYTMIPRSDAFQREEIRRIEAAAPAVVVLQDIALDGRDDLRFRNTNPIIDRYLHEYFRPVEDLARVPGVEVLIPAGR